MLQTRGRNYFLLIVIGTAINLLGAQLAISQGWMLFLDTIGTVLAASMGGAFPAIVVGFLSNVFNSLADPITLYYGVINVMIALAASFMARGGVFRTIWRTLLGVLVLSIIGGGLGSVLTWLLYGFSFGTGISAPLANYINDNTSLGMFFSQFSADMAIDIIDKLITMLVLFFALRLLPNGIKAAFPMTNDAMGMPKPAEDKTCRHSLRRRVVALVIVTSVVISSIAMAISISLYRDSTNSAYIEQCQSAVSLMRSAIDGDELQAFLDGGEETDAYREVEAKLYSIRESFPGVIYMYVYQIRPDACYVIFDLDTPDLEAANLGELISFDDDFMPYMPSLLAGEEIEPIITNGQFGWLLTVYQPVRDSSGNCVAYAAADVDMQDVVTAQLTFVIRLVALLFGATIVIMAYVLYFVDKRMVIPINSMADAALGYAEKQGDERTLNAERMEALHISTGDELENLYRAICKTFMDASDYLNQIKQKNAVITRLQDNIIVSLASIVESKDENTGFHIKRTAAYVAGIADELRREGKYLDILTDDYCEKLRKSAPLHDIGKINVPDSVLKKPAHLTDEEFAVIKSHTSCGHRILQSAMEGIEGDTYLSVAADMAAYHHERWDGSGYCDGLTGDSIPLCARIMAVADVYDALVSERSYKKAMPPEQAVSIICENAGTQFDPVVVDAFVAVEKRHRGMTDI